MENKETIKTINARAPGSLTLTHDGYFREVFGIKRVATALLKTILPPETLAVLDLEKLTIENPEFTDELFSKMVGDVVYQVPVQGTHEHVNFFIVIEHKSASDHHTIFQVYGYVFRLCYREFRTAQDQKKAGAKYRLPPIVGVIVHNGKSRFRGKTELCDFFVPLPGLYDYLPKLKAILFDLSAIGDNHPVFGKSAAPELKLALTALKNVFRRNVGEKVGDAVQALHPLMGDAEIKWILQATWLYMMTSATYLKNEADPLLGKVFQQIMGGETMQTMVETWKAEGKAEGEAIGVEKGKAEGKIEGILAFLEARFGKIPKPVKDFVTTCTDLDKLAELTRLAATCESMDKFRQELLRG